MSLALGGMDRKFTREEVARALQTAQRIRGNTEVPIIRGILDRMDRVKQPTIEAIDLSTNEYQILDDLI